MEPAEKGWDEIEICQATIKDCDEADGERCEGTE